MAWLCPSLDWSGWARALCRRSTSALLVFDDLVRLAVDAIELVFGEVASLALCTRTLLRADRMTLVGHRVVARLLLCCAGPRLLGQPELASRELCPSLGCEFGHQEHSFRSAVTFCCPYPA